MINGCFNKVKVETVKGAAAPKGVRRADEEKGGGEQVEAVKEEPEVQGDFG